MKTYLFKIGNFELRIYSLMYIISLFLAIFIAKKDEVAAKKNKLNFWVLTDMAVGPLILGQGLGRIGNFANGEIHGFPVITPMSVILKGNFNVWWEEFQKMSLIEQMKFKELVPWGIIFPGDTPAGSEFPNMKLHPAMFYEMILNFITFILIWFILRKKEYNKGILSMIYIISYGIIRIIVSTFRTEDLLFYGIRAPYIISLVMVCFGIIGIFIFNRLNDKNIK